MQDNIEKAMARLGARPLSGRSDPTDARLNQLEAVLGVQLPESYRKLLTRYGRYSVVAGFDCETLSGAYIEFLYGFPESDKDDSVSTVHFDELMLAPTAITIGCDLFGNQIVMFLDDALRGRIYIHLHDGGVDFLDDPDWQASGLSWKDLAMYDYSKNKPDAFQNLHFIADSFDDFLKMLRRIERD